MLRLRLLLLAAAALAAAGWAVVPTTPASAATCSSAAGVSVVVDFHELGGGVRTACVADGGGRTAGSLFPAAGFPLTYVQRQPGFVCRVSGAPADDPCVNTPPADAYWGLWWSDGRSGSWTYASTSAGSLRVPDSGYVAFSWNGGSARSGPAPHIERQGRRRAGDGQQGDDAYPDLVDGPEIPVAFFVAAHAGSSGS